MKEFLEACLDLSDGGSLCCDHVKITVHRFDEVFWALWNNPVSPNDLGRILKPDELKVAAFCADTKPPIGIVISPQVLAQRGEWIRPS